MVELRFCVNTIDHACRPSSALHEVAFSTDSYRQRQPTVWRTATLGPSRESPLRLFCRWLGVPVFPQKGRGHCLLQLSACPRLAILPRARVVWIVCSTVVHGSLVHFSPNTVNVSTFEGILAILTHMHFCVIAQARTLEFYNQSM